MTWKHCHDDCDKTHCHDDCHKRLWRHIFIGVVVFILVVLFTIFLVWVILRPSKPSFVLQDYTLNSLNLSDANLLGVDMQVTIATKNPNDKIGIYYEKLDVYASYHDQRVSLATELPASYQGRHDIVVWSPFLYGNDVPMAAYLGEALRQDLNAGLVFFYISIDGRLKWKVGTWTSGEYRLNAHCPVYLTFGDRSNAIVVGVKYQFQQHCTVDVAID